MKRTALFLSLLMAGLLGAATIKLSYRATNTAITATHLNGLATSVSTSTGIWASAFIDNSSTQDLDEQVYVKLTTGTTVTGQASVAVYAFACPGGTVACTDGITGSEGTQTITNPTNLIKLGVCNTPAASTTYYCGPFSIANVAGGAVPTRWGIVMQNLTGGALNASGNTVVFDSIQGQTL